MFSGGYFITADVEMCYIFAWLSGISLNVFACIVVSLYIFVSESEQ